jgi:phosphatidylinositol alpha-1,6-mannosyltransferase
VRILFLTPDLFGSHGGIARHCRLALKAMTDCSEIDAVDVISLVDRQDSVPDPCYFGKRGRSYQACGGDRRGFAYRVAAALRNTYDLVIAGHVNLAPLVYLPVSTKRPSARLTLIYGIDAWARLPWFRRMALKRSDLVVSISRFTAEAATAANDLEPAKVSIVACCLDPLVWDVGERLAADPDQGLPGLPRNTLLTVSRLSRAEASKGHDTILRALPSVLTSIPDVTYAIVGEGDLKPVLERLVSDLRLEQHVRFLGALPDRDLRRCYDTCTAYAMPSRWEGFGLVFLEAMAHARPIIASQRDAAPEVLGDTALLVSDPDDAREVGQTITRLLSSPELQTRLGKAGRARLVEHFTYERFRMEWLRQLSVLTDSKLCVASRD